MDEQLPFQFEMSNQEFFLLSNLIQDRLSISWDISKKELAYTRLQAQLIKLGLKSFMEYYRYLMQFQDPHELQEMINAVTTNKTDFFREKFQLDYLANTVFPQIFQNLLSSHQRKLRIWCAGCSTGEEAYTLAILLNEFCGQYRKKVWDIKILASDINTQALAKAKRGYYTSEEVLSIEPPLLDKYFEKGYYQGDLVYRAGALLRTLIQFRMINFKDARYPIKTSFELLVCRNVIIYFDKKEQEAFLARLHDFLHEGGYLLLGHSEYIKQDNLFKRVAQNIYQKK